MRKSDKKIDQQLRRLLTEVCTQCKNTIKGFEWLTHRVNYSNFPKSLKVICVFDSNSNLQNYLQSCKNHYLQSLINKALCELSIKMNNVNKIVSFDTEQNCQKQHNGNWAIRLS